MALKNYSTIADENTYVNDVFIGEGCPAANLNDATREVMADLAADVAPKLTDVESRVEALEASTVEVPTGSQTRAGILRLAADSELTVENASNPPTAGQLASVYARTSTLEGKVSALEGAEAGAGANLGFIRAGNPNVSGAITNTSQYFYQDIGMVETINTIDGATFYEGSPSYFTLPAGTYLCMTTAGIPGGKYIMPGVWRLNESISQSDYYSSALARGAEIYGYNSTYVYTSSMSDIFSLSVTSSVKIGTYCSASPGSYMRGSTCTLIKLA